jgi:hypothetical protein
VTDVAGSDGGTATRTATLRRWLGPVVVLVAAAMVVWAVDALLALGEDQRPPAEVLADTRTSIEAADAVRFTARIERTRPEGPDGTGAPATATSTEKGRWVDGGWHVTANRDPWSIETVIGPDGTTFTRMGGSARPIPRTTVWQMLDDELGADLLEVIAGAGAGGSDAISLAVAQELYLNGGATDTPRTRLFGGVADVGDLTGVEPAGIVRAMERLGGDTARREGDTVTATLRAPAEWVDAFGAPLPDGRAELDLGDRDRPAAFRLHIAAGVAAVDVEVTFEAWDEPLVIDVPHLDDPEVTPWVQEEAVRAADVVVYTPLLPDDWALTATAGPARERFGTDDENCDMVTVDFRSPPTAPGNRVTLHETPVECATAADATPFTAAAPGARPSRLLPSGALQFRLGDTVVELTTTLTGPSFDQVLLTLAPTAPDTLVAAAEARAERAALTDLAPMAPPPAGAGAGA